METIRIKYLGELRTQAEHLKSGEKIITDAPTDNQGKGEAFSPTDLMSSSLGSCMMTLMGIAANTHEIPFEKVGCQITKIMDSNPRRVKEIVIKFDMGDHYYSEKQKTILIRAAETCPVALSLHPDLKQTVSFQFAE